MISTYGTLLLEAIQAKCQREQWFGADLDSSKWHIVNSDFDSFDEQEKQIIRVINHPRNFSFAFAPASEKQVRATEARLGLTLPPLLKALYMTIANGGFGPGTGLRGIEGGYDGTNHDGTLADLYPTEARTNQVFDLSPNQQEWLVLPQGRWPREVLCLADMGCAQEACLDAFSERMYILGVTADDRHVLEPLSWTLEEWLWRWVRNEGLVEQYAPGVA